MNARDAVAADAPMDAGLARRTFLARTAAVTAALAAGQLTWEPSAARAAVPALTAPPGTAKLPVFDSGAWVYPRAEARADPTELTIAEAAWLLRARRLSPVALVEAYLDRIEAYDAVYQAFATLRADDVLAEARAIRSGRGTTPLFGIPLAIKDNYFTAGVLTAANSTIFADFVPDYDATAVARLTAAGGLVLGKTQMGPLATTRATLPNGTVTTVNAWTPQNPAIAPGGSSTGSATATAGRLATSSIGTQTGGSITEPSRAQNLTGLKPTMGRVSLSGIVPLTFSRDHPGPLARTALDAAIMLTAMAGEDEADFRTQGLPPLPNVIRAATPVRLGGRPACRFPTRIGIPPDYLSGPEAELRQAFLDELAGLRRVELVDVPLPDEWALLTGTFNAVRLPERTQPFLPFLRSDLKSFGVSLTSWLQGLFLSGDEWITGQRAKVALLDRILDQIFGRCDVVVQADPVPFDIVGLPELALPIGFRTAVTGESIPAGTILGSTPYAEDRLFAVAAAYQSVTDWHLRRPADPLPVAAAARSTAAGARSAPAARLALTAEEAADLSQ